MERAFTLSEMLQERINEKKKEDALKEKRCARKDCLKSLPATERYFGTNKNNKDGLSYYCRSCQRKLSKKSYLKRKKIPSMTPAVEDVGHKKIDPAGDMVKKPTPIKKPEPTEFGFCNVCEKKLALNLENFHQNLTKKTGLDSTCRSCRNEKKRAARGTGEFVVKIDFTNHQEVFAKIKKLADDQLRGIESQALWMLLKN